MYDVSLNKKGNEWKNKSKHSRFKIRENIFLGVREIKMYEGRLPWSKTFKVHFF